MDPEGALPIEYEYDWTSMVTVASNTTDCYQSLDDHGRTMEQPRDHANAGISGHMADVAANSGSQVQRPANQAMDLNTQSTNNGKGLQQQVQDVTKQEPHVKAGTKELRHWNNNEQHAKMQVARPQPSTKNQEPISSLVVQQHGLHHTVEERKVKLQAAMMSNHVVMKQVPISTSGREAIKIQRDNQQHAPSGMIPPKKLGRKYAPQLPRKDPPQTISNSLEIEEEKEEESQTSRGVESQPSTRIESIQTDNFISQNQTFETLREGPINQANTRWAPENPGLDSPSRMYSTSGLVEARRVTQESSLQLLQEAQQVSTDEAARAQEHMAAVRKKELQYQRLGCCLFVGVLVILAISLGVGVGSASREPATFTAPPTLAPVMEPSRAPISSASTDPISSAPTGYLDLLLADLPDDTQKKLQNTSSPQSKAYLWLSLHNNISSMEEWRMIQLFALATFFYSFEGDSWPDLIKANWMDDTINECLWFTSLDGTFSGIQFDTSMIWGFHDSFDPCNGHGEFQGLIFEDISPNFVNPSIPPEIALLTSLSDLSLRNNEINATITQ